MPRTSATSGWSGWALNHPNIVTIYLVHAHRAGIVHRELKTSNVVVAEDGNSFGARGVTGL